MRINFVVSQCYQNLIGKNARISRRKLKHSILRIIPATNSGGTSGDGNFANLWKDNFSAIANSVGYTDSRDQVVNALRTVPGHNDVINVHELRQIVRGRKNNKAVGNDGIPSEVYKFASEGLMSIFISGCMLSGKLPVGCLLVSYQLDAYCMVSYRT